MLTSSERPTTSVRASRRAPQPLQVGPRRGLQRGRARVGRLLVLPTLVLVTALLLAPVVEAIYYSMTNWNGISAQWVGPHTYVALVGNPTFWRVLENNGIILLSVPLAIGLPLGVATMLNERVWGWQFFRSAIFLPTAISWVVIAMVARQVFGSAGSVGSIDALMRAIGLGVLQQDFLGHPYSAIVAVAITFMWSMVGTNMIILLTGMATIDRSMYEAAQLDGASRPQVFRCITVPQLRRYFQLCFIVTMITAFTALFSLIFVMTGGGPGYSTTTLEFFVYEEAFQVGNFGTAAMLGLVLFVILFSVSLVQLRLLREAE